MQTDKASNKNWNILFFHKIKTNQVIDFNQEGKLVIEQCQQYTL